MTTVYCPAAYGLDDPDRASWRCNLLPGHQGPHDDGIGDVWGDAGPGRLQVAAVCLLGSQDAWEEIRPMLERKFGVDIADVAVHALGEVLRGWAKGEVTT